MSAKDNKEFLKAGQVLIVQGQIPGHMYYLHSGAVEILSAPKEFDGLDPLIIVSKSKRVGTLKDEILITGFSSELTKPSTKSVRAITDSSISRYPVNGGITQIVKDNPSQALMILNHLFRRLELAISDDSKYISFYNNICKIIDNISLMCMSLPKANLPENLQNKAENVYNVFMSNNGDISGRFDAKFLISDNSGFLKKRYAFPGMPVQSLIEPKQCALVKKFLKADKNSFTNIIKEDPSILQNMMEIVTDNLIKVLDRIYAVHEEIDTELEILFGSTGWPVYLIENGGFDMWLNSGRLSDDFIKNFLALIKKLHSYYSDISGKQLVELYPGPKKIHEYYVSGKSRQVKAEADQAGAKVQPQPAGKSDTGVYRNSLQQIFEFALVDKELQKTFLKELNDFKSLSNPFSTEQEGRKARRIISKQYWDLFAHVFLRKQKEPVVPHPVKLMLKFGFLDETLLEGQQVSELHELSNLTESIKDIPVLFEEEFLSRIYKGTDNPSITDMGLSYEAFKREEEKRKGKKLKQDDESGQGAGIDKIIYEINHRLSQTVAICSGSTATAFPILTSMTMKMNPKSIFTSKSKLTSLIKELMEIDYSVFYRETTLKLGNARELIQEEVIPIFILLPSFGTKTMMWQELDGKNRRTRGRVVIPVFFLGDMVKSLTHTFASFRWELNRTIKGGLWADPVEGGITGAYFDYINFYKKNSKLSAEAKAKVTERFKSLRTNRDRFADDYMLWLLFEKDGVMRLNGVVREMFYRHIPFKKEIRDKLEGMPAFAEIATRYKNIHARTIEGYVRRFRKYMEDEDKYPEKIQEFFDFLNM